MEVSDQEESLTEIGDLPAVALAKAGDTVIVQGLIEEVEEDSVETRLDSAKREDEAADLTEVGQVVAQVGLIVGGDGIGVGEVDLAGNSSYYFLLGKVEYLR